MFPIWMKTIECDNPKKKTMPVVLDTFYKNGKKLEHITMKTTLDFWDCYDLATYFYLMNLEDYAFMLNMDYEVNQSEGAVYLTSK